MQPFNLISLAIDLSSFFLGWFMGTAFGPLIDGVAQSGRPTSLRASIVRAEAATDWRIAQRWRNTMGPRVRSTDSSNDSLVIAGIVVFLVLYFYVQFSDVVVHTLILLSGAVVLAAAIALFTLWRRGVIDGRDSAVRILIGSLLGAIGITSAIFLVRPLFHADALVTLHSVLIDHAPGPAGGEGITMLVFIAYQLLGAILTIGALVVAIAYCFATVNAVYIEHRAIGRWAWLVGFWFTRWSVPRWVYVTALSFAIVSVAFTSGWIFSLLEGVSSASFRP